MDGVGREDIDFYLQCKKHDLKTGSFSKLAPITTSGVFNGESIAIPKEKMNLMHYEIYRKWGDNISFKRDERHPDYIHCSTGHLRKIKPITYRYDISSLENWERSIPYKKNLTIMGLIYRNID